MSAYQDDIKAVAALKEQYGSSWAAMRDEMKAWLRAQGLPGDAVLMIGETAHEREMMASGGLAGFVAGQAFFGRGTRAGA